METWKTIEGWPTHEVSDQGRVRRILPPYSDGQYHRITLSDREGRREAPRVHRVVAETFLGPCPTGYEVNHLNGDKLDNRLENIEYVTPGENSQHAHDMGLTPPPPIRRGGDSNTAKLTESDVREIRRLAADGVRQVDIASRFPISQAQVSNIVRGAHWSHVR